MIKLLILLLSPIFVFSQSAEMIEEEFVKKSKLFKYTLSIAHSDSNSYAFEIIGLEKSYDSFIKDTTMYYGEMKGDGFSFTLNEGMGEFVDTGRLWEGKDFYEGLYPCSIVFILESYCINPSLNPPAPENKSIILILLTIILFF
jgi:hypothetical protein